LKYNNLKQKEVNQKQERELEMEIQ